MKFFNVCPNYCMAWLKWIFDIDCVEQIFTFSICVNENRMIASKCVFLSAIHEKTVNFFWLVNKSINISFPKNIGKY